MVRVGGLEYSIEPSAKMGGRISDMRLNGKLIDADKKYRVAGWASVSEESQNSDGEPIWDLMARYLKNEKIIKAKKLNEPVIKGVNGNPGIASI